MFFSSQPTLPFQNTHEGLGLHPQYKMLLLQGSEIIIEGPANGGDKAFQTYRDLINSAQGKDLVMPSLESILLKLTTPGYFFYSGDVEKAFVAENKLRPANLDLYLLGKETALRSGLVLPKYSPLTPMFNEGLARQRSSGMLDTILRKALSYTTKSVKGGIDSASSVNIQQVALVLFVYVMALASVAVILAAEWCIGKRPRFREGH